MPAPTTLYRPYLDRFANPSGPGDSRPTASEIIKDLNAESKLKGKTVLITGGNSGLGLETAKVLHSTGAQVFVAARSEEKAKNAAAEVSKQSNGPEAQYIVMDLGSLASVRAAAAKFAELSDKLDILITNAGIMATPFGHTEEGFEQQFGCNHLGHFLLFRLLQPLLSKSATETSPSRVIALSSGGHRFSEIHFDDINYQNRPYEPLAAYAQSKTANIWMANSIERHYAPLIRGLSVHPGVILETGITRHFQEDTLGSAGDLDYFKKVGFNVQQGAATSVWAALEPHFDQAGGVYLADVGVARPAEEGDQVNEPVYAPYAYDEEGEERLWRVSSQMIGLSESE